MKFLTSFLFFLITVSCFSQEEQTPLPFYELPEYPEQFTAGTMASRMVDALGFRYYWSSVSLTDNDLAYKANKDGRSSEETIKHIYDLSKIIVNSTLKQPNSKTKKSCLIQTCV